MFVRINVQITKPILFFLKFVIWCSAHRKRHRIYEKHEAQLWRNTGTHKHSSRAETDRCWQFTFFGFVVVVWLLCLVFLSLFLFLREDSSKFFSFTLWQFLCMLIMYFGHFPSSFSASLTISSCWTLIPSDKPPKYFHFFLLCASLSVVLVACACMSENIYRNMGNYPVATPLKKMPHRKGSL